MTRRRSADETRRSPGKNATGESGPCVLRRSFGTGAAEKGQESRRWQEKWSDFVTNLNERRQVMEEEGEIKEARGGLVPRTSFLDGQVDHGSITVTKDMGRRIRCKGRVMRPIHRIGWD